MREGSAGEKVVEHEWGLPKEARPTAGLESSAEKGEKDEEGGQGDAEGEDEEDEGNGLQSHGPFVSRRLGVANSAYSPRSRLEEYRTDKTLRVDDSPHPHTKRPQQWVRARGRISPSAGPQAHLSALAYMSDSWFIGTVSRVHNLWPFGKPPSTPTTTNHAPTAAEQQTHNPHINPPATLAAEVHQEKRQIGMMVSLDHTIYFHRPRDVVADEWLFSEMESPWAGEGRGLVLQRIWDKEGRLLASCVQEVSSVCLFVDFGGGF
jgi:acyl-CoA thioesterase